ncbi:fumarylacetoacetate hydrolase family protein [Histidinibacterium aquaticum]|uniref:Fumarylacetoacetate hydrolase family protein n=1 Tax=Histidinibacterium aquaticum TaxID=2613962 RepID=A0A5J5GJ08_9RHOB|nr:fumarylacetoacetate hydrolase family protein [Histidinibacterium aquaticum]KAA9008221.1 fumarylacetoacetate hydrolase family protein [Histidinibacterium aquaticum]
MKFLRIGPPGAEIPCVMDEDGQARDISSLVPDISPETIPHLTESLAGADLARLPAVPEGRLGAPIARPRNVWCIGLNYSDHAAESGMDVPAEPILFSKSGAAVCGPTDPILKSAQMTKLDWEVELGVVIGRAALEIAPEEALDHVLGYCAVNDVSERAWQAERGGTWIKGKSYPNFCPTGPWLVTADEVPDPQALSMDLSVNGETMQRGSTDTMVYGVAHIVHYLSQFVLLEPGDLICTGTPPGVGMGMKPPRYLDVGDTVRLSVEGLGGQETPVVSAAEGR